MHERTYKIKIKDPNRIVSIKNKEVRTPTEAVVSESELRVIKTSLVANSCTNFEVEILDNQFLYTFPEVYNPEVIVPPEKKVVPTYDEVKAKLLSKKKIVNFRIARTKTRSSPGPIEKKINSNPSPTSFYIPLELQANKIFFPVEAPIVKEDFEVKIEDLKIESDSILRKLLREKT